MYKIYKYCRTCQKLYLTKNPVSSSGLGHEREARNRGSNPLTGAKKLRIEVGCSDYTSGSKERLSTQIMDIKIPCAK